MGGLNLDAVVQRGPAASGIAESKPAEISAGTRSKGGLISGGPYIRQQPCSKR